MPSFTHHITLILVQSYPYEVGGKTLCVMFSEHLMIMLALGTMKLDTVVVSKETKVQENFIAGIADKMLCKDISPIMPLTPKTGI